MLTIGDGASVNSPARKSLCFSCFTCMSQKVTNNVEKVTLSCMDNLLKISLDASVECLKFLLIDECVPVIKFYVQLKN